MGPNGTSDIVLGAGRTLRATTVRGLEISTQHKTDFVDGAPEWDRGGSRGPAHASRRYRSKVEISNQPKTDRSGTLQLKTDWSGNMQLKTVGPASLRVGTVDEGEQGWCYVMAGMVGGAGEL